MSFRITSDTLTPSLDILDEDVVDAIHTVLDYYSTVATTEMRSGARWTDRTTNARNGLMAKAFNDGEGGSLVLWHQMPYGIWLEVRWSGRYAIVGPVMNSVAPRILRMIGSAIERSSKL